MEKRTSLMAPQLETLLEQVDSKFTLLTLAAMRGRQINSYFSQLGAGLGAIVPPQVTSVSRKPLTIALEEIAAGKLTYKHIVPADQVDEAAGANEEDDAGKEAAHPEAQ